MKRHPTWCLFLLGLSKERPSHKMLAVLSPKGGLWSQAFNAWTTETGDESAKACVIIRTPFVNIIIYTPLCFMKAVLRKLMPFKIVKNLHSFFHSLKMLSTTSFVIMHLELVFQID